MPSPTTATHFLPSVRGLFLCLPSCFVFCQYFQENDNTWLVSFLQLPPTNMVYMHTYIWIFITVSSPIPAGQQHHANCTCRAAAPCQLHMEPSNACMPCLCIPSMHVCARCQCVHVHIAGRQHCDYCACVDSAHMHALTVRTCMH